tara:strand:- start:367 stop:552 length:186 start_codon:yes stop_codon:yes gene_type:complete
LEELKMGIGEDVAEDSCFRTIVEEAESYKDENDLWKNSADFGRFVIDTLTQDVGIDYKGGD